MVFYSVLKQKKTLLFTSCQLYWVISAEHFASLEQHVWTFTQVSTQSRSGRFSRYKQVHKQVDLQIIYSLWLQHKFVYMSQMRVCLGQLRLNDVSIQWFFKKSIMMINNCLRCMVSHRHGEFLAHYRASSSHTF